MSLHVSYLITSDAQSRLDEWDLRAADVERVRGTDLRTFVVWSAARDASVSASTGIEGNPLTPAQVEQVLAGGTVDGEENHVREVENYNRALDLARAAASRADFAWSHEFVHLVNAAVMESLPRDTHGNYRSAPDEEIHVGIYTGPSPIVVQRLMDALIRWLRTDRSHPLIRSALLHLNIIAIHPFNDGNGRTARLLAAAELVRAGIHAPELISVEAYLRRHRDEYVGMLRSSLGLAYDPENQSATEWLDYYTRISLDRLTLRNRIQETLPADIGQLVVELQDAGDPVEWAFPLLAARLRRLRTAAYAEATSRSLPAARAELGRMVRAGWLEPRGVTRGRWYAPSDRLAAVPLQVPELMRLLAEGDS